MFKKLALVLTTGLVITAGGVFAAEPPQELAKCQTCHGADGNGASADMPRLNGQPWPFLANRVRSFRYPTQQTPHATFFMMDVNSSVSDTTLVSLAKYFAEQGRKLYQTADGNLPSCQSCHGSAGEGHDSIPRLNGQHAVYLRKQLESFSMLARVNQTLNPHIRNMTAEQIASLVAFLSKD
jgi:cytochrome c553